MTKASLGTTALVSDRAPASTFGHFGLPGEMPPSLRGRGQSRSAGVSGPLPEGCELCHRPCVRYLRVTIMDTQGEKGTHPRHTAEEGELEAPEPCPVLLARVQPVRLDSGKLTAPTQLPQGGGAVRAGRKGSPGVRRHWAPHTRTSGEEGLPLAGGGRGCWLSLCETTSLDTCTELLPGEPGRTRELRQRE